MKYVVGANIWLKTKVQLIWCYDKDDITLGVRKTLNDGKLIYAIENAVIKTKATLTTGEKKNAQCENQVD